MGGTVRRLRRATPVGRYEDEHAPGRSRPVRIDRSVMHGEKPKSENEDTRVHSGTALGGLSGRSASRYVERNASRYDQRPATVRRSSRPVSSVASADDRRYLHGGNDRDILQRPQRPELEWLRIERRVWIERRVRIERRCRQQHIVHPGLPGISAGQPTLQLTGARAFLLRVLLFSWSDRLNPKTGL